VVAHSALSLETVEMAMGTAPMQALEQDLDLRMVTQLGQSTT